MERLGSGAVRGRRRGRTRGPPAAYRSIAVAVDDPAARQVIWRELDAYAVTRRDAYEVAPHASCRVGDELVAVLELDLEHGVRQRLRNDGVHDHRRLFVVPILGRSLPHLFRAAWTPALVFCFPQ